MAKEQEGAPSIWGFGMVRGAMRGDRETTEEEGGVTEAEANLSNFVVVGVVANLGCKGVILLHVDAAQGAWVSGGRDQRQHGSHESSLRTPIHKILLHGIATRRRGGLRCATAKECTTERGLRLRMSEEGCRTNGKRDGMGRTDRGNFKRQHLLHTEGGSHSTVHASHALHTMSAASTASVAPPARPTPKFASAWEEKSCVVIKVAGTLYSAYVGMEGGEQGRTALLSL